MPLSKACWPSHRILVALLSASLLTPAVALADEAPSGEELAQAVFDRPDGDDLVTRGTMTLTGERSRDRVRESFEYRLDGEDGESWSLIRFTSPANIEDTALLVHNHPDGESDQWLHLPAADRVRRVSGDNRGSSFVQSDLYFEDLEDRRPEEDEHRLIGTDTYGGREVWLLESKPVEADNSTYSRRLRWIDPDTLVELRIDFYRGGEDPIKRLEVQELEKIDGYWTVTRSTMSHLEQGTQTVLEVDDTRYDQGLPQDLFTSRVLSNPSRERPFRP
ncbi:MULTISPECIES: outer membrane lipoprotein-sorting protein [Halorhodospira]|uniref:outer membrane lipoprotein-sorting protein n=1 Tax=Halorhodospira TaxID=85108 RepID=UPI001EE94497|nr:MULTISPECIES: outer membrane lipoprotein-sorting protein [Halorhodospira]MCG5528040.1 outer membrane lipoprotein-sorting protein [Halorhodospira halophila]MCG5542090.1 outer membrane lipoprotein-sorting protein [Halorhodospira sp. 9628]